MVKLWGCLGGLLGLLVGILFQMWNGGLWK